MSAITIAHIACYAFGLLVGLCFLALLTIVDTKVESAEKSVDRALEAADKFPKS